MTSPDVNQDDQSPHASSSIPLSSSPTSIHQLPSLQIPRHSGKHVPLSQRSSNASLRGGEHGRLSVDAADYDSLSRSPILTAERDTGLRRIRQAPSSLTLPRNVSTPNLQPSSPMFSAHVNPRKGSMNMSSTGPTSPTLTFGEDLTRFPSESLHSFSFTEADEPLYNRHNVLKRSIEFMRDKGGWAATSPRIASAQARLAGDEEMLGMMELMQRANALGAENSGPIGLGIDRGPLTGPAHTSRDNVFEQSLVLPELQEQSESPTTINGPLSGQVTDLRPGSEDIKHERKSDIQSPSNSAHQQSATSNLSTSSSTLLSPNTEDLLNTFTVQPPDRPSLKRTFTDIATYSLQQRLTEAMAQPYHISQTPSTSLTHTSNILSNVTGPPRANTLNERAPHGYRGAKAQAIFTTESKTPWTITAANDLACLIFGVTRAEVRKLGIMEVIKEDRRGWLEERLKNPDSGPDLRQARLASLLSPTPPAAPVGGSSKLSSMGNGVTAKLLSKPPARGSYASRRSKTENNSLLPKKEMHHSSRRSRGVLLCGDIVPIRKMNGETGSASLWVKEKANNLIWVVEEIAENVAYLEVDEIGLISRGSGDIEPIFGLDRVRNGMDVQRLIPSFPKLAGTHTGAVDYDAIEDLTTFTARTANSISIPIAIARVGETAQFRISSFPHIAGIIVVNPQSLKIQSSNSVFSNALFGYRNPAHHISITDLIPGFDKILRVLTDEDRIALVDGVVIPEHSFRRARSLIALREGASDAAALFLKPSGLPARHRDGAGIMIDVQMRVVKSDREPMYREAVVEDEEQISAQSSELVYALWITYNRQLHAVNHGIGPVSQHISRPSTPPRQPAPILDMTPNSSSKDERITHDLPSSPTNRALEVAQMRENSQSPGEGEPYEHPSPELIEAGARIIKKKRIDDFTILEEMGQGAYGQVKLARYKKTTAEKMVIKYVTKRRILVDTWHRDRRLGTVPLEIHVLDYLRREGMQHPNIVEMADFFEDDINYYIEMVPHGLPGMDLFDYIELRAIMEELEARRIFIQVAAALQHLHINAKVVHRDIKDENIILDGDGRVKVVDFGSAAYIKNGPFDVFVGTIDYAAPEVLSGLPYRGKEQDVWALGILLYTIVYKENPFYSVDEIMDHDLRVPFVMSEECLDLIRRMLDRDVERRISIEDVMSHVWCTMPESDMTGMTATAT